MKILVLGDSHSGVFEKYSQKEYSFKTVVVPGASARGAINPNSKRNALNTYKAYLVKKSADKVIIGLGEVDCGYIIWYKQKFEGSDPIEQMNESLNRLFTFIENEIAAVYRPQDIIVMTAPLPTIDDNTDKKFLHGERSKVDTPLAERLTLTINYNRQLVSFAEKRNYSVLDITEEILDTTTMKVKDMYLNENKWDHHLNSKEVLPLLIKKLNKIVL